MGPQLLFSSFKHLRSFTILPLNEFDFLKIIFSLVFFFCLSPCLLLPISLSFFLYLYFFLYLFQHESHSIDPLTLAFIYVHSFSSIHPFIHSSTPSLSLNILENCVKLLFICSP